MILYYVIENISKLFLKKGWEILCQTNSIFKIISMGILPDDQLVQKEHMDAYILFSPQIQKLWKYKASS